MKRLAKRLAISVAVVCALALTSYLTTSVTWDGAFPRGAFRLNVRSPEGEPVKGAVLRVCQSGTRELAFGHPLHNYLPGQDLVSDESGVITAIRKNSLPRFGGHSWQLFWVIGMGAKAPEYDCEITARGYEPLRFSVWRLFESEYTFRKGFFPKLNQKVDGKEIKLRIYEHTFTLERHRLTE